MCSICLDLCLVWFLQPKCYVIRGFVMYLEVILVVIGIYIWVFSMSVFCLWASESLFLVYWPNWEEVGTQVNVIAQSDQQMPFWVKWVFDQVGLNVLWVGFITFDGSYM